MDLILSILGWILLGLVAGLIARLLVPGRQALGWVMTIGLGIAGSLLGGLVMWLTTGAGVFAPAGWLGSIICATGLLALWALFAARRRRSWWTFWRPRRRWF
ncbi:GlsB/YeaQ/YmgE family stress response membrane protein [Lignipirellula cremea]|uniref:Transglycosylase associated protein n=1 Tax=Lignipirellula cremea TaxID=2528010 RepID=A0A518DM08_9BACT|nr:GlsB/YeaQ/YmgE family stress response membrane protein [Lignipirellula cremea]QDU92877.1 hypothetical protein Pla8534_06500 [Lignipirellula cremea]